MNSEQTGWKIADIPMVGHRDGAVEYICRHWGAGVLVVIDWYLEDEEWLNNVTSGNYQNYYEEMDKNR